jgi:hypothetical protein
VGAVAILVATLAASPANPGEPATLVKGFYEFWLSFHASGLPSTVQREKVAPFLSSDLLHLIRDAQEHQARLAKENPAEKPPFADGDLFSSNFEGATRFTVGAVEPREDGFRVAVRFEYADPRDPKRLARWEDAVFLKWEGARLALDDVEFLAPWPFASHGRLSEALKRRY